MQYSTIKKCSVAYIVLRLIELLGFGFIGSLIVIAGGSDSHAASIFLQVVALFL